MVNEAQATADARMISKLSGITCRAATPYVRPNTDTATVQSEHLS
ncbi:hypothetical protein [Streptomyces sp. NPDC048188]